MTFKPKYLYFSICLACIFALGCNQETEEANLPSSSATVAAKTTGKDCSGESGCCGGCASEKTTTEKRADECCGKCASEQQVKNDSPKEPCGDCSACADGDEANCKCDKQPAASGQDSKQSDKRVNSMPEDREIFHFLLQNHEKLTRKVTVLENGVETITESTDPELVGKIQEHVASMYGRVEDGRRIRMWDTLYQEIFKHADKIEMKLENTSNGIKVIETSDDPYVVKLIQEHAKVVSGFVEHGFDEARKNHPAPKK